MLADIYLVVIMGSLCEQNPGTRQRVNSMFLPNIGTLVVMCAQGTGISGPQQMHLDRLAPQATAHGACGDIRDIKPWGMGNLDHQPWERLNVPFLPTKPINIIINGKKSFHSSCRPN